MKPFPDPKDYCLQVPCFTTQPRRDPKDWDLALAVLYKNNAATDNLGAKFEMVRDKILGGNRQANELGEKREEIREVLSSVLLQEIMLK